MQLSRITARGVAILLGLGALAGCENELPTVTGEEGFPQSGIPTTIEVVLPADQFLTGQAVYDGFGTQADARFLLIANAFDNSLSAHTLARFTGFADSVSYTSGGTARREAVATYGAGRITVVVDSASSFPAAGADLEILPLIQDWDTSAVSWRNAVDRIGAQVTWRVAGGTTGPALAVARWDPANTRADSVTWTIDSLSVVRLANRQFTGVLVRPRTAGARLEISQLILDTSIRPAGRPDTAIAQRITTGPHAFIFTPDAPATAGVLRAGGLSASRPVLQLNLAQTVPTCPPPQTGPNCRQVSLREVTIDRISLLLDPVPVPQGFRPLRTAVFEARRVLEPELGSRAPLGEVLVSRTIAPGLFASAAQASEVALGITAPALEALQSGSSRLNVALMTDLGVNDFGAAWFDTTPKLRLLYTVTSPPQIP